MLLRLVQLRLLPLLLLPLLLLPHLRHRHQPLLPQQNLLLLEDLPNQREEPSVEPDYKW